MYYTELIFCLYICVIGSNSVAAFDPEKRGKKTINDHLESVRNLALSRDGRREASKI